MASTRDDLRSLLSEADGIAGAIRVGQPTVSVPVGLFLSLRDVARLSERDEETGDGPDDPFDPRY